MHLRMLVDVEILQLLQSVLDPAGYLNAVTGSP